MNNPSQAYSLVVGLLSAGLFAVVLMGVAYVAFRRPENRLAPSFPEFIPLWLKLHWVSILAGLSVSLLFGIKWGILLLLAGMLLGNLLKSNVKLKYKSEKELEADAAAANGEWLESLGPTHELRAKRIDQLFTERAVSVSARHFIGKSFYKGQEELRKYISFEAARHLGGMDRRERSCLRVAELLNSAVDGQDALYRGWRAALLYGDGKGNVRGGCQYSGFENVQSNVMVEAAQAFDLSVDRTCNAILSHLSQLVARADCPPTLRKIAEAGLIVLTQSNGWLQSTDLKGTPFEPHKTPSLHLGSFDDGTPLAYSGTGALLTIAPPGSGKSQCHVISNLLEWRLPAIVLDVKDELYAATSRWRAENVGPVYRFAPTRPEISHHYNPIALVSDDPEHLWQESRFVADMMIVPSGDEKNKFWDASAKEIVTASIAHICHSREPQDRNMEMLLDILHGGKAFEEMLLGLQTAVDIPAMVRTGTKLAEMNERTRADALATVHISFQGWGDAPVARVTGRCDWHPLDLRRGQEGGHPTIYFCLRPSEIESYISILRVFVAQHIRTLTRHAPEEADRSKILPILFMLDELPRLREMPPVAEAIEIGDSYGLRLWMFAQSLGQMQNAYRNADGMMGSCAVRAYMNPGNADGLAEKLSDELGFVDSAADGSRVKLAEASELSGPNYKDKVLVFGRSIRRACVNKVPAWCNEPWRSRMGSL